MIDALKQHGFLLINFDSLFLLKRTGSYFIALIVDVDDLVIASDNMEEVQFIKKFLHEEFKIKDLRELKFFLGLEIVRSKECINVFQCKYT